MADEPIEPNLSELQDQLLALAEYVGALEGRLEESDRAKDKLAQDLGLVSTEYAGFTQDANQTLERAKKTAADFELAQTQLAAIEPEFRAVSEAAADASRKIDSAKTELAETDAQLAARIDDARRRLEEIGERLATVFARVHTIERDDSSIKRIEAVRAAAREEIAALSKDIAEARKLFGNASDEFAQRFEAINQRFAKLPAPINPAGNYRDGVEYAENSIVTAGGRVYIAKRRTTERPSRGATDWVALFSIRVAAGGGGGGGGDSLPSQVGNAGKFLTTDGTTASWATLAGGGDLLAANNLSDLASAAAGFNNIKQAASTTFSGVVTLAASGGVTAGTVVQATDSRLTDARTPTAHATSHQSGGGDAIKLDDLAAPDDNTDLDATTSRHGLLRKLNNSTTAFLRGDGEWATPASGSGDLLAANNLSDLDSVTAGFNNIKQNATTTYSGVVLLATSSTTAPGYVVQADDTRLTDDRDPNAHATTHQAGGSDAIRLDDLALPEDNTDLNASTTYHGLLRKLSGSTTAFLRADGEWATPSGGSGDVATDTIWDAKGDLAAGTGANTAQRLAAGNDGDVLAADSSATTGLAWRRPNRSLFDFNVVEYYDDFISAATGVGLFVNGAIGSGGTSAWSVGGGGLGAASALHNHEIRTGTTDNAGRWCEAAGGSTASNIAMDGTEAFEIRFLVSTGAAVTNLRWRMGLCQTGRVVEPVDYIGFRFDADVPDTNFRAVARAASSDTLGTDSFGAPATNTLYEFRMWSTGDGVIRMTIDGGTEVTLSSGLPSVKGHPFVVLCTNDTVDRRIYIDAIAFRHEVSR